MEDVILAGERRNEPEAAIAGAEPHETQNNYKKSVCCAFFAGSLTKARSCQAPDSLRVKARR
ncbi:hypothetical protein [Rhodovulum sp. 12E13]|uniref:hypothetical protein n=1 Tax=Rhodovulum sp. 12E13 TaxID=2203891 RepID=UPI0011C06560|nr:hypothetical protein [Rhodovulum sp. 12E13]